MSLGLYLHIPFCKQKCLYCDFNSYAGKECAMDDYCKALAEEIFLFSTNETVDTIYFGGGTPTVIGAKRLGELLEKIMVRFSLSKDCEITAECNPGTIDKEGLAELKKAGFNRLSIGLQSADDDVLKRLGRIHSFADFKTCFHNAREVGFNNLSLDLMYGLPGQSLGDWMKTLKEALVFAPEHISCYALKVEEGTPFAHMELALPDDEIVRRMYDDGVTMLEKAGYLRYEISNFAKPNKESRHNVKYWQCDDFAGFGAGAYSCIGDNRYDNLGGILDYCKGIEERKTAIEENIPLTKEDKMSEFCFLGLRLTKGIDAKEFEKRFSVKIEDVFGEILNKNIKRGTIIKEGDNYRIASEFLYVSNGILADFV